jgi:hypothetical protein
MRIAHLILTHKNPDQLERLVKALDHPCFDLFIHVDRKTDVRSFTHLARQKQITLIEDRVPIYWAGYGTIQATLNGCREIMKKGGYDYINVMSGQDYPLRPAHEIYEHLTRDPQKQFITCESVEHQWTTAANRVKQYHLINWRIPGKHKLERMINRLLPARKFPLPDFTVVGRSNWFTLTIPAMDYLLQFLEDNPRVVNYFKYCWGADEFIFSTVIFNSPFRQHIVDNLMYVDWTGRTDGHPRVLLSSDLPALQTTEKLFARKFDIEKDAQILDLLEKWISPRRIITDPSSPRVV